MKINNREKGRIRDTTLLHTLEEWGVADILQITKTHFSSINGLDNQLRKAEERLFKLYKLGKIKRWMGDDGYVYSLREQQGRDEHLLCVNWVRLWLEATKQSWEKMHCFLYEEDYKVLRTDGFVAFKNTIISKFRFAFVELDRTHSNAFDKVKKYNQLFEKQGYSGRWWVDLTEKFPVVLTVTTTPQRRDKILQHIKDENKHGLRFEVKLLSEIKKEVINR